MKRLGVATAVLAVGLSAGLAGCGGNPATRPGTPQATDNSTASADPTGTPGDTSSPQTPGATGSTGRHRTRLARRHGFERRLEPAARQRSVIGHAR